MSLHVAVLGAGNGGLAAAADLTLRGHRVCLYTRSSSRLQPVIDRGGIELMGAAGKGFAELALVTTELREAISGADLIMLAVPVTAHQFYARALAPILEDGQPIFLNPGHTCGGLHLVTELRRAGYNGDPVICEASTLTYGCRIQEPAQVMVHTVVSDLPFAAYPGKHQDSLHQLVKELYPALRPVEDVLVTAFLNINAIEHPPMTLLNAGWIEYTNGDFYIYYEGVTPAVGRVIDAVDRERLALAEVFGVPTKNFVQMFHEAGYTTAHAVEVGTAYQALQESAPNRWVKSPSSLDHRYVHEDVGFGLVPWTSLAKLAGVETPTMDYLIQLASTMNGRDYRQEGLTLERLGLENVSPAHLKDALYEGVH